MQPVLDYVYGKEVVTETGVVSNAQASDTKQKYQVISVGAGHHEYGIFIEPPVRVGDIVVIQKHAAEGDTPPDMLARGYALFRASRVMAIEKESPRRGEIVEVENV